MEYNYCLFLDDFRHPYDAFNYTKDTRYLKLQWVVVRSYDEFVKHVIENGVPNLVSFDHDLADEHYHEQKWSTNGEIDYFTFSEKTGYDCAKWLCDYCLDNNSKFPDFLVHSWNNIGSENIRNYIRNFRKHNPVLA